MQKQKIDCFLYLVLQNTYDNIEFAIFDKEKLLVKNTIEKHNSSKNLIPDLDKALKQEKINLNDFNFIGVNKGPGPFTTLRVVITTANSLNFSSNIPLIGINGIEALIKQYNNTYSVKVALLNAYNNDIYFAIKTLSNIEIGYKNIDIFLKNLKEQYKDLQILFIGNATELFSEKINNIFGNLAIIDTIQKSCSIEQIANIAYENWKKKENITNQIIPLYLKEAIKNS